MDKVSYQIQNMFDSIADKYDFMNNIISLGTHKYAKSMSIKNLSIKPRDKILDLCCGTGDLAIQMKKQQPEAEITGVDFSEKMLEIAMKKSRNENIAFINADCTRLPFADNSFDVITMGFGLRNISDTNKALSEAYRVLKYGGQFLHIDFGRKNFFSKIFDKITPVLVKIFYGNNFPYNYLIKSKQIFPPPEGLIEVFESEGFKLSKRKDYLFGIISSQIMTK